jgi:hypothetical protein
VRSYVTTGFANWGHADPVDVDAHNGLFGATARAVVSPTIAEQIGGS